MWNRNFILLLQGQAVSQIGTQMFSLGLLYWVLETTGSATAMGLILMSASLPGALFGPVGGALADRFDRRWVMVITDALRGVAALAFVATLWWHPELALIALIAAQIVFGLCGSMFAPAMSASVPLIVPRENLQSANSWLQGTGSVTQLTGLSLGGVLYAAIGAPLLFLINGLSYLFSAVTELFLRLPHRAAKEAERSRSVIRSVLADTADGLRYVWATPGLRPLIGMLAVVNCVLPPVSLCVPLIVRDALGQGPEFLGFMGAAQSAGAIAGFALMGSIRIPAAWRSRVVVGALVSEGFMLAAIGMTTQPAVALVLITLFGLSLPVVNVNVISVIQMNTPNEVSGRVFGLLRTIAVGLVPFSQGLGGVLIDAVDQRTVIILCGSGSILLLVVVCASLSRNFHRYVGVEASASA